MIGDPPLPCAADVTAAGVRCRRCLADPATSLPRPSDRPNCVSVAPSRDTHTRLSLHSCPARLYDRGRRYWDEDGDVDEDC